MQSYQYARMSSGAWTLLMVAKTGEEFHLEKIRPDIRRLLCLDPHFTKISTHRLYKSLNYEKFKFYITILAKIA